MGGPVPVAAIMVQEAATSPPPILGLEAQLMFVAFLTVVLVVPWIMARAPGRRDAVPDPELMETSARSRFSSARERRLWIWVAIVLVAIYSTLSPAQQVAAALRERGLLGVTTTSFLLLVGIVVAVYWARTRPGRFEVGAAVGVAAVYVTTLIRLPVPEARSHLFEYGLVAILIYQALRERHANGRPVPMPALTAALVTALLGWVDEGIQLLLPNRVYDLVDVGLNAAFATMAIVASVVIGWARGLDLVGRLRRRAS